MNLYILRHAIADLRDAEKYPDDTLRPLVKKGRKKLKKVIRLLAENHVSPDFILTSPALRALDTASMVRKGLALEKEKLVLVNALLPEGAQAQLIAEIKEKYNVGSLMIVGHEPNLSMLISHLLNGEPNLSIDLHKAGLCCLSITDFTDGRCATLDFLLDPTLL